MPNADLLVLDTVKPGEGAEELTFTNHPGARATGGVGAFLIHLLFVTVRSLELAPNRELVACVFTSVVLKALIHGQTVWHQTTAALCGLESLTL